MHPECNSRRPANLIFLAWTAQIKIRARGRLDDSRSSTVTSRKARLLPRRRSTAATAMSINLARGRYRRSFPFFSPLLRPLSFFLVYYSRDPRRALIPLSLSFSRSSPPANVPSLRFARTPAHYRIPEERAPVSDRKFGELECYVIGEAALSLFPFPSLSLPRDSRTSLVNYAGSISSMRRSRRTGRDERNTAAAEPSHLSGLHRECIREKEERADYPLITFRVAEAAFADIRSAATRRAPASQPPPRGSHLHSRLNE